MTQPKPTRIAYATRCADSVLAYDHKQYTTPVSIGATGKAVDTVMVPVSLWRKARTVAAVVAEAGKRRVR